MLAHGIARAAEVLEAAGADARSRPNPLAARRGWHLMGTAAWATTRRARWSTAGAAATTCPTSSSSTAAFRHRRRGQPDDDDPGAGAPHRRRDDPEARVTQEPIAARRDLLARVLDTLVPPGDGFPGAGAAALDQSWREPPHRRTSRVSSPMGSARWRRQAGPSRASGLGALGRRRSRERAPPRRRWRRVLRGAAPAHLRRVLQPPDGRHAARPGSEPSAPARSSRGGRGPSRSRSRPRSRHSLSPGLARAGRAIDPPTRRQVRSTVGVDSRCCSSTSRRHSMTEASGR